MVNMTFRPESSLLLKERYIFIPFNSNKLLIKTKIHHFLLKNILFSPFWSIQRLYFLKVVLKLLHSYLTFWLGLSKKKYKVLVLLLKKYIFLTKLKVYKMVNRTFRPTFLLLSTQKIVFRPLNFFYKKKNKFNHFGQFKGNISLKSN